MSDYKVIRHGSVNDSSDSLMHYGVKGMHWRFKKQQPLVPLENQNAPEKKSLFEGLESKYKEYKREKIKRNIKKKLENMTYDSAIKDINNFKKKATKDLRKLNYKKAKKKAKKFFNDIGFVFSNK